LSVSRGVAAGAIAWLYVVVEVGRGCIRMSRSRGREIALQALYQRDINPGIGARNISNFLKKRLKYRQDQVPFARDLLAGVQDNLAELDRRIQLTAENWRIERMPVLDRNILRLGLYEILTGGDGTPPVVAVNEAVDLAKRYAGPISGKFVNGILDQFLPGNKAAFKLGDPMPEPTPPAEVAAPVATAAPLNAAMRGLRKLKQKSAAESETK